MLVAWALPSTASAPTHCCLGRRMTEGAANLVDHVLPEDVPIRQWVLTLPYPLRFPLAFDAKVLGAVLRIFTDTVAAWYRARQTGRCLPDGACGAVTVIQRASSDLWLNPHFHTLFLDGTYGPGRDGGVPLFHPAPGPTQNDVEAIVHRASKRILRFLKRRGVISLAIAPRGRRGERGMRRSPRRPGSPAGPSARRRDHRRAARGPGAKRAPVRIGHDPLARPVSKGKLCAQH